MKNPQEMVRKNVLKIKKPVIWMIVASIIILFIVGILLVSKISNREVDLSFLNPTNMLSIIGEEQKLKITSNDYGETFVSGAEFAKWLDIAENDWKRKRDISFNEYLPSIIIHVDDKTGTEILFFESKITLAMTLHQDEYRYYAIPEEDYKAIATMLATGYPQVQSLTFTKYENGNDEESITITDEKVIMQMAVIMQNGEKYRPSLFFDSTQNDQPPVSDYIRIVMSGDKTYFSAFIYSKDDNYYIDRPYEGIRKITKGTMNEIMRIYSDVEMISR